MKIIADEHIPFIKNYFAGNELILKPGRSICAADVKHADLLLVRSITTVNEALLKGSQVKFVGSMTAGIDHVDTHWLEQAGIYFGTAKGFNAQPVADYVLCCIAALREKQLLSRSHFKVAIIGVGHVGKIIYQQLSALNCDIQLCDPIRASLDPTFQSAPLQELVNVDLILLHVPLTKHSSYPTYHFINKAFLERQNPGCVILNASRGAVIHTDALLQYGQTLHWCLDVFENEPLIDQVVMNKAFIATPHIAGYSKQSKLRGVAMLYSQACEQQLIYPNALIPVEYPHQTINLNQQDLTWEKTLLAVFDPLRMTETMRMQINTATDPAAAFDKLRSQFKERHEFNYTTINAPDLPSADQKVLKHLGFKVNLTKINKS